MTKKEIISLIILILVVGYGAYKYLNREYSDTQSRYLLDTIVEISAKHDSKNINKQISMIFEEIQDFEKRFNEFDPESYISQINSSEQELFPMHPELYEMLVIADSLYQLTGGAFDVTIKPVWDLWDFGSDTAAVPPPEMIAEQLKLVGFDRIRYSETELYKPQGMQLTFGAIAKGYIFEKSLNKMRKRGYKQGFIDSRSSIAIFGEKLSPIVYISHPRHLDATIAHFRLKELSVSTSGDYQQFFLQDGKRYHHIIDAHTGYPTKACNSITVLHPSAAWADGLSTALFLMPIQEAIEYVNSSDKVDCIIYYEEDDKIKSLKSEGIKAMEFSETDDYS